MPRLLIALLVCSVASAEHTGTVQGTVIDSATRQPIRKAAVTLTSTAPDKSYAVAITDFSGRFTLPAIPPGSFLLLAAHSGFVSLSHATPFNLAEGETRAGITLLLVPVSRISGTVTNPEGEAVRDVQVTLYRKRFRKGKPLFSQNLTVSTDPRGHYEFGDVSPGDYQIAVQPGFADAVRARPIKIAGETVPLDGFASQVYPEVITAAAGRVITDIGFHLAYAPRVALHGTVTGIPDDIHNATVHLEPASIPGDRTAFVRMSLNSDKPAFQVAGITAGPYRVVVEAGSRRSLQNVQLTAPDTELNIALAPGVPLAGSIEVEGPNAQAVAGSRIALSPRDGLADSNIYTRSEDNAFEFEEVPPGIWDVDVSELPRGAYIKSMHLGKQDVLLNDMVIGPDSKGPLAIVISTAAPIVEGVVEPAGPAFILAVPTGPRAQVVRFHQTARTDEKGRFTITGFNPGAFRFYAFRDMEPDAWQDPKFLPPFESHSKLLELKEGATETLTLSVP